MNRDTRIYKVIMLLAFIALILFLWFEPGRGQDSYFYISPEGELSVRTDSMGFKAGTYYNGEFFWDAFEFVVTDSIVWRTISADGSHLGDENCQHEWVYSNTWRAGYAKGCLGLHHGFHCPYDDQMRNRICGKCFRKETQREFWFQTQQEHIETEYEKLEKKLKRNKQ